MKTQIMMILSLTLLTNCLNPPVIADQEQLSTQFVYETIDGKEYISVEKSKCLARTYRITLDMVGAIDKNIKLNIKECDKVVGYASSEYVTLASFMENLRIYLRRNQ